MIVYRFERNGIGPYVGRATPKNGSFFRAEIETRTQKKYASLFNRQLFESNNDRHEMWSKAHANKQYIYGCKSKEQLRAYFGGEFKHLFKQGYRIKRYKAPDDEVIDMVVEVAFPVKYHKLQTVEKVNKLLTIKA